MTAVEAHPAAATDRFFLPKGYRERKQNLTLDGPESTASYWTAERIANSAKFQFHVYRLAAALVRRHGLASVLDVGCGPGTKLKTILAPVCSDIEGMDQPPGVAAAKACGAPGRFTAVNLERPQLAPWRTFDLIVCADVVEHLMDPDPMLAMIRGFCHEQTIVVLSTPERRRLRGRECNASEKPEHVREWSQKEFLKFVRSRGFVVRESRLFPQDDSPVRVHLAAELKFRLGIGARSGLCCHAAVCGTTG